MDILIKLLERQCSSVYEYKMFLEYEQRKLLKEIKIAQDMNYEKYNPCQLAILLADKVVLEDELNRLELEIFSKLKEKDF